MVTEGSSVANFRRTLNDSPYDCMLSGHLAGIELRDS